MLKLGVNIDHVATLREARYRGREGGEPDPIGAALICESAGAHGITAHLREDRRHMQDRDIRKLREVVKTRLNLEMASTPEILSFALQVNYGSQSMSEGQAGNIGIGFAMPISRAKMMLDEYRTHGRIVIPVLGLQPFYVSGELADALELPNTGGLLILRVEAGSVAHRVDLRVVDRGPGIPVAQREVIL